MALSETDVAALLHSLEVHQAELETQNQELRAGNDELRRANAELAFARDRYQALQELAPVPLVTIDRAGTILDVNRAAEALFASPRSKLIERRFAQLVADSARAALPTMLARLFAAGSGRGVELVIVPEVAVLVDGAVLPDEGPARAVLALVDVSARERLEEARRSHDRRVEQDLRLASLGVLAGGIAHDFNNLLTIVLGGADQVRRHLPDGSPLAEGLDEVRGAARRAGVLAHQLLALAGQQSMAMRDVDVGACLADFEPSIRSTARGYAVELELPRGTTWIIGDALQLRTLILNLVANAADAMADRPGALVISVRATTLDAEALAAMPYAGAASAGPCVLLEVRDSGEGMTAAALARIFEPYFSTRALGRGLGLAVVQGIVRGHGGALAVESAVGRGAAIRVYLPAIVAPVAKVAPPVVEPVPRPRPTRTVLIVDDDLPVQRVIARIVRGLGFDVWTAASGEEALEVFSASYTQIHLVLMDFTMPGMNGGEAAAELRRVRSDVPIVLVTGYGDLPADLSQRFNATLIKPFDVDSVRAVLEQVLPLR